MISKPGPERARVVSIIAATVISLACGTNYVYSAWAPQFAQRLKLSSTESNLIGTFGNLGMYASGLPSGMMVDAKGPRWGVALGIVLFALGYYPIQQAYVAGPGSSSVPVLCLFSFFTGAGSASAFTAAIKTAALNYPLSRGTATAFPLAAFGLSAFAFSAIASFAVRDNTSSFLLILATGTVVLPMLSFFFLRVAPPPTYMSLPHDEPRHNSEPQILRRTRSTGKGRRRPSENEGSQSASRGPDGDLKDQTNLREQVEASQEDQHETSSLLSQSSTSDPEDLSFRKTTDMSHENNDDLRQVDIRGFALLPHPEFWHLFLMLGLLTGIGLMTINNIGNDTQALWRSYDDTVDDAFIQRRQNIHVSALSFCSFCGRLLSGIGSDILVKKLNRSRFWCLFFSALIFCGAQAAALGIQDPNLLFLVSTLTGLAYGILFGVYPSIIANTFGVNGLSQNWGTMTLAPVISGNIFNIIYGKIYDGHSIVNADGQRECLEGLQCYRAAYWVTFAAGVGGILVCLWSVWHENQVHKKSLEPRRRTSHEREA